MKSAHQDRLEKLNDEIVDAQGFLEYWLGVCDPELLEQAPGRIAMLEFDLESLQVEYKAILADIKAHS